MLLLGGVEDVRDYGDGDLVELLDFQGVEESFALDAGPHSRGGSERAGCSRQPPSRPCAPSSTSLPSGAGRLTRAGRPAAPGAARNTLRRPTGARLVAASCDNDSMYGQRCRPTSRFLCRHEYDLLIINLDRQPRQECPPEPCTPLCGTAFEADSPQSPVVPAATGRLRRDPHPP